MEKIQITKTIKKFNEFSETEQETILDNYRNINLDFEDWNDYILSDFIEEIKKETKLEIDTSDIIYSVGDRDSKFGVNSKDIINQLLVKFEDKGVYDINTTEKLGSFLNHRGGGICSQNHTEHDLAEVYFEDEDITDKQKKAITEEINTILNSIIDLCSKYHNRNEESYNSLMNDESVKETIETNDYDFDIETLKIY